ncbi:MAG: cellobiose phosphorylase [Clostridiales bacterium]|nr:cellobiose phosphorylase [Clostridiales bacterium]
MEQYHFINHQGTFTLDNPELTSYLYFPIANEGGMMSSVTPEFGGDAKTGQNTFVLEPVSSENLHNNKSTRNFWLRMQNREIWSATGASASQQARKFCPDKEKTKLTAGLLYQTVERESAQYGLRSEATIFAPLTDMAVELMKVTICNTGEETLTATPIAAIPLYARSADNIRDHRNVTSMLHRIRVTEQGVTVVPTLTFDERGHQKNHMAYGVFGRGGVSVKAAQADAGESSRYQNPTGFYPVAEDFIGEGGSFENPYAAASADTPTAQAGDRIDGFEAMGGLVFREISLRPGEKASYVIALGCMEDPAWASLEAGRRRTQEDRKSDETEVTRLSDMLADRMKEFLSEQIFDERLEECKAYWNEKNNIAYRSGDQRFDEWMYWVNFQPMLRRIYGCSFLPHHDYGKGGRGWRDLWQDCLALLLMNPSGVRKMLLSNFGGVRLDGTNATIIGNRQGEFIADRNGIPRVWMDHGMWPYLTVELYVKQSGDFRFLLEKNVYFKDNLTYRGDGRDAAWEEEQGSVQKSLDGKDYQGTVLEHILLQHLSAFYDVGEHNHIRLRGADWNDAIDMAKDRGESVAFTTIYGGNLSSIAGLLRKLQETAGVGEVELAEEMLPLLSEQEGLYDSVEAKQKLLREYCESCAHTVSGRTAKVKIGELARNLEGKAEWLREHVRRTEWVGDDAGNHWFNGYYDNSGRRVEGKSDTGVRMMLTGQVFSIMSGTATDEQVSEIVKAADAYLYDGDIGGYKLNTDFHEVKTDMGRMFGFAYGQKENGAVFCHMAVMYANALYQRGFAKEGYRVIHSLYSHICDVTKSRIYPGVPEYIDPRGRGVYHYLTGAASWLLLTVLTQMFGVQGRWGDLALEPKLLKEQFDAQGKACVEHVFNGKKLRITYENPYGKDYGEYRIDEVLCNGARVSGGEGIVSREILESLEASRDADIPAGEIRVKLV